MYSRTKIFNLKEMLRTINIEKDEFVDQACSVVDIISSASPIISYHQSISKILKAEEMIVNLIHEIITEINPDMNELIELDDIKKSRYDLIAKYSRMLKIQLNELKRETLNKLTYSKSISRIPENDMKVELYYNNLLTIFHNLVFLPLYKSYIHYCKMGEEIELEYLKDGKQVKEKKKKGVTYFWFNVYSYFLNSISTMEIYTDKERTALNSPHGLDVRGLGRAIGTTISQQMQQSQGTTTKSEEDEEDPPIAPNDSISYFDEAAQEEKDGPI